MEPGIIELGGVVVAVVTIARLVEFLVGKFMPAKGVAGQIEKLAGNDLNHIYEEMETQTTQHGKQIEVLTEIKTILNERKY